MRLRHIVPTLCGLVLAASVARAQANDRFANFETPQTHPIEIARVGESDYVLVCNTPDNSVEIYRAAPPHAFVARVPVGLGPASVRWNPVLGRFYTCNFDGDSVSIVRLDPVPTGGLTVTLERTDSLFVGDEPSDIAFDPTDGVAVVSLASESAVTLLDPLTLAPAGGKVLLELTDPLSGLPLVVKNPRQIAWLGDGRFFAANLRGGSPAPGGGAQYDVGLYRLPAGAPAADFIGGLGTTNHAFELTADGGRMFVVGTKARNHAATGVAAVSQLVTGFVQSWLMVVDVPPGGAMTVRAEAPAGALPAPLLPSINLNRNYGSVGLLEVGPADAIVQPTDVELIQNDAGEVLRIAVAGYHSDRIAILRPSTTTPGGYAITRVNVPLSNPAQYSIVGPRGLAYHPRTGLLFTNGRLDNSLNVIDPVAGTVTAQIALQTDPTPSEIRLGRQFLYSSRFSIDDSVTPNTGGKVSCAVCHVDGRMDGIPWDLGTPFIGPPIPPEFHDQNGQTVATMPNFPDQKGPMMTQTLQGLVNYLLNEEFQFAATAAPYHWRGDKADFTDFNEAFVNLQGMDDIGPPGDPKGITDAEMVDYRRFVNTILHPPNPEQDPFRTTPGSLGANPNDPVTATGGKLGMMLYHDFGMVGARSCVDCHSLPDGSTNTATLTFFIAKTLTGGAAQLHPMETAELRSLAQREMALHSDFTANITHFSANNGLLHPGNFGFLTSFSTNTFITGSFVMPGPGATEQARQAEALVQFVRQLDTGTAPLAGFAYTADGGLVPPNSGLNATVLGVLEDQVDDANVGLAVHTRESGTLRGYWYDITVSPPAYREEGTTNLLTRTQLLNLAAVTGNVVVAQATPLGGERRVASPSGVATVISNTASSPANLTLEAMAPDTAFVDVTQFNLQLNLGSPPDSSIWTQRTLQQSVVGSFGVPAVRHEPPRRFRVTGENIRPGARLLFAMASGASPASFPVEIMQMNLYPTEYLSGGRQVWETRVELDATQTFALLNGGYFAPDVANVLLRTTATPSLQPAAWNQFLVAVQNEDGTLGFNLSNWQALTVQDGR